MTTSKRIKRRGHGRDTGELVAMARIENRVERIELQFSALQAKLDECVAISGSAAKREGLTVAEFCRRNGISRAYFFALRRIGKVPRTSGTGTAMRISRSAEAEWRHTKSAEKIVDRS